MYIVWPTLVESRALVADPFVAFDENFSGFIDWRDFVSALRIVVKPRESMVQRLRMFFQSVLRP